MCTNESSVRPLKIGHFISSLFGTVLCKSGGRISVVGIATLNSLDDPG
jgi:hypothetical protein